MFGCRGRVGGGGRSRRNRGIVVSRELGSVFVRRGRETERRAFWLVRSQIEVVVGEIVELLGQCHGLLPDLLFHLLLVRHHRRFRRYFCTWRTLLER